jgi:hypothetical protein
MKTTPTNIGGKVQLFFDNYMIEMAHFLTRTMHSPKKDSRNPILKKDRPWEEVLYFRTNTFNVYRDEREKLFKIWYEDLGWDYEAFMGRSKTPGDNSVTPQNLHETMHNRYLYAESEDGIEWRKPELNYLEMGGKKTNICLGGGPHGLVHAATFIQDALETDEARRYKALYWHEKGGMVDVKLTVGYSRDGRSWTADPRPVEIGEMTGHVTGDVVILTQDTESGEYWLDTREKAMVERFLNSKNPINKGWGFPQYPDDPLRITRRRIYTTVSDNLLVWPALKEMLIPDDIEDNLDDEFYGMVRFRMGDLFLGFLNVHRRTYNTQEIYLIYSRDGFTWHRAGKRQPFLGLGTEGDWDRFMVETCTQPVRLENELRIYYAGSNLHHDWWMFGEQEGLDVPEAHSGWNGGQTALGLATLRPEGFISIDSDARDSILVTRPFVSDGNRLIVNVACKNNGYFQAELADANDNIIPGYEKNACETFTGDAVAHTIKWKGKSELPREIISRGAKLRFYYRYAEFYSFRIDGAKEP